MKRNKSNKKRLDVNGLKNSEVRQKYRDSLRSRLLPKAGSWNEDGGWEDLRKTISDSAEETLPELRNKKRNDCKKNGEFTCGKSETLERWREHFKDLLDGSNNPKLNEPNLHGTVDVDAEESNPVFLRLNWR
ncbi:hypothetical protein JTE90_018742 [Oedothorax gibbosus]|uniref:Uncharacterized protein n=1 Tax=Oedothorax gibbosus TaxID=931172 RepID=A0AAV6UDD5_9ARAC|nr:hypothetical protein JTE90_018742 [Oedothorax gibbosus]